MLLLITSDLLLFIDPVWTNAMQPNLETKDFHLDHATCASVMQAVGRLQHADLLLQELTISIKQ